MNTGIACLEDETDKSSTDQRLRSGKATNRGNGKTDAVSGQARVPIASQFRPQTGTTKKAGKKQQMESSSPDFDQESSIGPPGASGGGIKLQYILKSNGIDSSLSLIE